MKLYYTMAEVCEMFNVARPTIGRWEEECGFPLRVALGLVRPSSDKTGRRKVYNCRIGFPVDEVDAWNQARKDARKSSKEGQLKLVSKAS